MNWLTKGKSRLICILVLLLGSITVSADDQVSNSAWATARETLSQTWQSTHYELYLPIDTWHNRSYYSAEKINGFNEQPLGLGIGKYQFDENENWNALFVMTFQDSHRNWEPVGGYAYQKIWRPADDLRLGAGYAVGLTIRHEMHYLPLPGILPILSVEYKRIAVQSTYVPGGEGHGNILFTWIRWQM